MYNNRKYTQKTKARFSSLLRQMACKNGAGIFSKEKIREEISKEK